MEHSNEIIKSILRAEFADYQENYWHYDREYKLIEKGIRLVNTLNLDFVMKRYYLLLLLCGFVVGMATCAFGMHVVG